MQRGSLALPTWLPCLYFDSQYDCHDVIYIFFLSAQIPWNKTSTIKRMSRRGPLFCLLYQEGFSVDSSIEFYQFCIVLKFGFIVEQSIILSSPMLPIFFKMVTDEICFCIDANKACTPRQYGSCVFVLMHNVAAMMSYVFASCRYRYLETKLLK